ncbi:MAG: H-NS histone family protein [Azovibrio sp.]|uniref:H-NS histone family protein n=1 Tax=Azovibrio sp. TaxID=1872673 RepID=UPI003C754980
MDISNLSLAQLKELERILPKEILRREMEEKAKVRKELEAFVQARGFSLGDLVGNVGVERGRSSRSGSKVAPKYRHPRQADLEWTGRGRKPKWVEDWLSSGGSIDQLLI